MSSVHPAPEAAPVSVLASLARWAFVRTGVDIRQFGAQLREGLVPESPRAQWSCDADESAWQLVDALEARAWQQQLPCLFGDDALDALASLEGEPPLSGQADPWQVWLAACPDPALALWLQAGVAAALPGSRWLVTRSRPWRADEQRALAVRPMACRAHRALHEPPPPCRLVVGHGMLHGASDHVRQRLLMQLATRLGDSGWLWAPHGAVALARRQGWRPWCKGSALLRPPPEARTGTATEGRARPLVKPRSRERPEVTGSDAAVRLGLPSTSDVPMLTQGGRVPAAAPQAGMRVHYQPLFDLATDGLCGVEALLRWHHPAHGLMLPQALVRAAEDNGGIHALGRWVLREACTQLTTWRRLGFEPGRMAVNVSVLQWQRPGFVDEVLRTLHEAGMAPADLVLEISESRPWPAAEAPLHALARCRAEGIGLSLDDFGNGHAGLLMLERLPVDQIKLDRALLQTVPGNRRAAAIVRQSLALARELGIEVVVEGVERDDQLDFLRAAGCRLVQGHRMSAALSAESLFTRWSTSASRAPGGDWRP